MTQRTTFAIAAALTAFVLVIVGGATVLLALSAPAPAPPVAEPPTPQAPAADPTLEVYYQQREAAYQQQLAQASAQLEQANARLQEAYRQMTPAAAPVAPAPTPAPASAAPVPSAPAISAGRAARIALDAVPGAQLRQAPEEVSYQGLPAYEVALDQGLVYVDAATGAVLYNEAAVAVASRAPAPRYEEGEHEREEHSGD